MVQFLGGISSVSIKSIIIILLCLILSVSVFGKDNKGNKDISNKNHISSTSKIVSISESLHDFGYVKQNSILKHTFTLTNISQDIIKIKGVATSCACTGAVLSEKEVLPGTTAKIEISFNSSNLYGDVYKTSLVLFENKEIEPIEIRLKAFVFLPSARLRPKRIDFGNILPGTPILRTIKVVNLEDNFTKWKIQSVSTSSPTISAKYLPNRGEIQCQLMNTSIIGPVNETVIVSIQDPNGIFQTEIPFNGQIIGSLKVEPERLFLGTVNKDEILNRTFIIKTLKENSIVNILSYENILSLKFLQQKHGEFEYEAEIKVPAKQGFFKSEVLLKTDLQEQPLLCIPYAGYIQN